jgi:hypothetical protein
MHSTKPPIHGTATVIARLIDIMLGLLHPNVFVEGAKKQPSWGTESFIYTNNEISSIRKMLYSTFTAGVRKGLFSGRVHVSPPPFPAVFLRSCRVVNLRNYRIAVSRRHRLLYVGTYTVDRSSILFDSRFFVSRQLNGISRLFLQALWKPIDKRHQ